MKVKLFISPRQTNKPLYAQYHSLLQLQFGKSMPEIELTEQFPDIIHVIGSWDSQVNNTVSDANFRKIPVVLSTLGGLSEWNIAKQKSQKHVFEWQKLKKTLRLASAIIIDGMQEQQAMKRRKINNNLYIIPNAVITTKITPIEMAINIAKLYKQTIDRHEHDIHENINKTIDSLGDNAVIDKQLCHHFLYLHYQFHRQNIHVSAIEQLKKDLLLEEYNEDSLKLMFQQLKMTDFASRLMNFMSHEFQLTEGFMPIQPIEDKAEKWYQLYLNHQ